MRLPCHTLDRAQTGRGEESKVAFDNCQNCTINVNIQYAGHKQ